MDNMKELEKLEMIGESEGIGKKIEMIGESE